jgi:YHS domain-containing protein
MELAPAVMHIKPCRGGLEGRTWERSKLTRKKTKPTNLYVLITVIAVVLGGLAAAALIDPAEASQGQTNDRSRICMLQDAIQPRTGLVCVYNGKKYHLCCGGCLAAFQRDAAIRSHATDPVDGKSVDKADAPAYVYQGHAYFFSSDANMTKFASDSERLAPSTSSQTAEK